MIRSWSETITPVDAAAIDRELRTATFLERNDDGYYRFSHQSFLEFFYARYLLSSAANNNSSPWDDRYFVREVYQFVRDLILRRKACINTLVNWIYDPSKSDWVRSNAIKCVAVAKQSSVTDVLLSIVKNNSASIRVRRIATTALGNQHENHVMHTLISLAESADEPLDVRSNALLALGRIGTINTLGFLSGLLSRYSEKGRLHGAQVNAIFLAGRELRDEKLLFECINYTLFHIEEKKILQGCLELIKGTKSPEAERLYEEVLLNTKSPKNASIAALGLPVHKRKKHVDRIINLISLFNKSKYAEELVMALSDVQEKKVESFLKEKVLNERRNYTLQAFHILRNDYPSAIPQIAPSLMYGKSQEFRFEVARSLYDDNDKNALKFIENEISIGKGVSLKIKLIRLIVKNEPLALAKLISKLWSSLEIPKLISVALQELIVIDKKSSLSLILERGLKSNRVGVRVISCAILSSFNSEDSTLALLKHLEHDDSRWVRLQALRSLLRPGFSVDISSVIKATAKEPDTEILQIQDDLLGDYDLRVPTKADESTLSL